MSTAEDLELFAAWRGGDGEAGERLLARHRPALTRFLQSRCPDGTDDLIQATLLAAVEARDRFRGEAPFLTFLLGIAHRKVLDHLRARANDARRRHPSVDFVRDLSPGAQTLMSRRELEAALVDALAGLSPELALVIQLHYWERLTREQIAALLALPAGTVASRLRRARDQLLDALETAPPPGEVTAGERPTLEAWAEGTRESLFGDPSATNSDPHA